MGALLNPLVNDNLVRSPFFESLTKPTGGEQVVTISMSDNLMLSGILRLYNSVGLFISELPNVSQVTFPFPLLATKA